MYNDPFHTCDLSEYSFLITGGAGFIGSHIVEYLIRYGAGKVLVMDNLSTGSKNNVSIFRDQKNYNFLQADVCDMEACREACRGIDFIFHEAALGSVPRSVKDPLATNQSNVNGFLNVMMAAKEQKVKRIVYASSSSVFGDHPALPKAEDHIGNPLSPYAVTKRVNELYAHVFATVYGMEIIGLRYFNIFGPRQSPEGPYAAAIPLFMKAMMENTGANIFGDGEQSRDFTFVENAVQANIRAIFIADQNVSGSVFNIAAGRKTSINELFNFLKEYSKSNAQAVYCPERTGDIKDSLADISKAAAKLGYRPGIMPEEGLKITFDWFRDQFKNTGK